MKKALLLLILLAGCALSEFSVQESPTSINTPINGTYRVIIPDVGQGGAAIIQTPDGKNILYDCGQYKDRIYDDLDRFKIKKIDLLITSNPDADHIGACRDILKDYDVARVVDNGFDKETATSMDYRVLTKNADNYTRLAQDRRDDIFPFIQYLVAYDTETYTTVNDNSVGMKLALGNATFLFTGDCESDCEKELKDTADLNADILYAGHHGSRTSSTTYALNEINPSIVVISVGKDNRYGHPHPEAIARIKEFTDNIYTTAEKGPLIIETDGDTLTVFDLRNLLLWKDV